MLNPESIGAEIVSYRRCGNSKHTWRVRFAGRELTARQASIAGALLWWGKDNKTIARWLGISEQSVKIQMQLIKKIFEVQTRLQLINKLRSIEWTQSDSNCNSAPAMRQPIAASI